MKTIGNILWLVLVGWHTAIGWLVIACSCASRSSPFPSPFSASSSLASRSGPSAVWR